MNTQTKPPWLHPHAAGGILSGSALVIRAVHECPECGQECDCDGEDHEQTIESEDCTHVCDEDDDDDPGDGDDA